MRSYQCSPISVILIAAIKRKTPEEALAFLLSNDLTKDQYCSMKRACAESNANIWPNYNLVLKAKKACRPPDIKLEEKTAEVPLQSLLNHTVARILHKVSVYPT